MVKICGLISKVIIGRCYIEDSSDHDSSVFERPHFIKAFPYFFIAAALRSNACCLPLVSTTHSI